MSSQIAPDVEIGIPDPGLRNPGISLGHFNFDACWQVQGSGRGPVQASKFRVPSPTAKGAAPCQWRSR